MCPPEQPWPLDSWPGLGFRPLETAVPDLADFGGGSGCIPGSLRWGRMCCRPLGSGGGRGWAAARAPHLCPHAAPASRQGRGPAGQASTPAGVPQAQPPGRDPSFLRLDKASSEQGRSRPWEPGDLGSRGPAGWIRLAGQPPAFVCPARWEAQP